ncbi:MAG: hypothetical protein JXQ73_08135 [Phycisphaerae bacterium]|nr:hypothetical protein [Phycisphaerae bacterium]
MKHLATILATLGGIALFGAEAQAYILQFESYSGLASAGGNEDPYHAEYSWYDPGMPWVQCSATADVSDLSLGGGTGEGNYYVGRSRSYASGFEGGRTSATACGTYTWRILSEYENTGAVTLTLHALGGREPGQMNNEAWGASYVSVASDLDGWTSASSGDSHGFTETMSFDVLIGGTLTVYCETEASANTYEYSGTANIPCDVSIDLPAEVPEPMTVTLLAFGGVSLLLKRRMMS